MEPGLFVMLDPATDDILSVCAGPADDGKCQLVDAPPYVCQGLQLVGVDRMPERGSSFIVDEMVPGRCPLAWIDGAVAAHDGG
jgi:hypothetical protein